MTSQKEFMIGCLIGGVIGALGTLAVPKKYVDHLMNLNSTKKHRSHHRSAALIRRRARAKTHARTKKPKH